jgi:hypothetical protein
MPAVSDVPGGPSSSRPGERPTGIDRAREAVRDATAGTDRDPSLADAARRWRAHARSVPPALLAGYCGRGEQLTAAITPFAHRYADQTEQDHEALADAVKSGRVAAELGI